MGQIFNFLVTFAVSAFVIKYSTGQEVCLLLSETSENTTNCRYPAKALSEDDMVMLIQFCEDSKNKLPCLTLNGSDLEYNPNFTFIDCNKDLPKVSRNLYWMTLPEDQILEDDVRLLGRKLLMNNTQIGITDFAENSTFEYMVLRLPIRREIFITAKESNIKILNQKQMVGFFAYGNPTGNSEDVQLLVDPKYNSSYNFDLLNLDEATKICETDSETNLTCSTAKLDVSKIEYNITVQAYTTISAQIYGQLIAVYSNFQAVLREVFLGEETLHNITGTKIEYYISNFYLENIQLQSSDVYVISSTTIYIVLVCFGVVLLAGLLVFLIRLCGRHFRNRPKRLYKKILRDNPL